MNLLFRAVAAAVLVTLAAAGNCPRCDDTGVHCPPNQLSKRFTTTEESSGVGFVYDNKLVNSLVAIVSFTSKDPNVGAHTINFFVPARDACKFEGDVSDESISEVDVYMAREWRRLKKGKDDDNESGKTKQSSGQPDDKVVGELSKVGSGEKFSSGDNGGSGGNGDKGGSGDKGGNGKKGGSGFKGGDIHMPGDKPEKPSKKESEKSKKQDKTTPDNSNEDGSQPAPPGETDDERMRRCKSRTNMCFLRINGWMEKNNIHFEEKKPGEQ